MNILHLEDANDDAYLIGEALRGEIANCNITRVETRSAFLDAIDHGEWDVILADYSLPFFDGISALKLVTTRRPDLPFIFVTGSLGEELAVATLKNGATDYILKHRLDRLPQAVERAKRENEAAKAQKETDQKLKTSLREKELLLQEVHHRVKNNLEIICSLLHMQSCAVGDPLLTSALQGLEKRIQSMAMIHGMLCASTSLSAVDFAEYIRVLAAEASVAYDLDSSKITLVFHLEPVHFEIDRAISCGLILNELLTNAFKHAFPHHRGGEIRISFALKDNQIRLCVEDDGAGIPDDQQSGLGSNIVDILTRQLGGKMEITSANGCHCILTFPM